MATRPSRRWRRARRSLLLLTFLGVATCGEGSTGPELLAIRISPDAGLAVGIAKNRMLAPMTPEENTVLKVANAVREALAITG